MRWLPLILVVVLGCTERKATPPAVDAGPPTAAVPPAAPVDAGTELDQLEREVSSLLGKSCTPCHAWSTWALVRTRSACHTGGVLVMPFDPEESALYRKLTGTPICGAAMPPTGRLPKGAAEAVRAWIAAGAPVDGKVSPPLPPEAEDVHVDYGWDPN